MPWHLHCQVQQRGVWHPCICGSLHCWISSCTALKEDNMTNSVTTVLQLLLQNYQEPPYPHILVVSFRRINQTRGVWIWASRNQGHQLSNAQNFIATQKQQLSHKGKKQSPPATELAHSSIPLSLPVAYTKNPPHKRKQPPPLKKEKKKEIKKEFHTHKTKQEPLSLPSMIHSF